jgi:hypothetical protein
MQISSYLRIGVQLSDHQDFFRLSFHCVNSLFLSISCYLIFALAPDFGLISRANASSKLLANTDDLSGA